MILKATDLRTNLFKVLDYCRDSGETVRVERGGEAFELTAKRSKKRIEELDEHPGTIVGDPDHLHLAKVWDWSDSERA